MKLTVDMKSILLLTVLLSAFACRKTALPAPEQIRFEPAPVVRYTRADLQKLRWMEGVWKSTRPGKPLRQEYRFNGENTLEITDYADGSPAQSTLLSWHAGFFYLGDNRDWVVTWIGEKDVRFEPTRPGNPAFTWTRFGDEQWYHVLHTPQGDQPVLMQRSGELQP